MKYSLILTTLFFTVLSTFAQNPYPDQEDAAKVLERTLVVQLLNEGSETAKFRNDALREVFMENWTLTPIAFKNNYEIKKLKSSKTKDKYVFLTQSDEMAEDIRTSSGKGRNKNGLKSGSFGNKYVAFSFSHYDFFLEIMEKKRRPTVITTIGMANGELLKPDYLYLCQQLRLLVESSAKGIEEKEFYNVNENINFITNNKLLLLKDFFKEKDLDNIPSKYGYKYELVDYEKYEDIILNKEKGYAYVKIIWSTQHSLYMWITVNSEDGTIKSIMGFGGVKFGSHHDANEIIKAKHLNYISNAKMQNFNNKYK